MSNLFNRDPYAWYLQEKARREKMEEAEEVQQKELLSAAPKINTFGLTDKESIEEEKAKFKDFYVEYLVLCKGEKNYEVLEQNKAAVLDLKEKLEEYIEDISSHYKEVVSSLEKFRIYITKLQYDSKTFLDWITKVRNAQKYCIDAFNKYYDKDLKSPEEYIQKIKMDFSKDLFQSLAFSLDCFEHAFNKYLQENPPVIAANVMEIEHSLAVEYTDDMKKYFQKTAKEFLHCYENLLKAPLDIRVEVYSKMQNVFEERMKQLGQELDFEDEPLNETKLDAYCPNDIITL